MAETQPDQSEIYHNMKRILMFYFALASLGQASAQFTPPVKIAYSPFYEYGHRAYDWDGDGDLDYIGSLDNTILHLYENTGAGHIANPVVIGNFTFNYNLLTAAQFGDLNADGRVDIIFPKYPDYIEVCLQMPDGKFAPGVQIQNVVSPLSDTELADLDSDGDLDLLVQASELRWYANDGSGNFADMQMIGTAPEPLLQVTDVDLNGLPDVFVLGYGMDTIRIFLQSAPGQFMEKTTVLPAGFQAVDFAPVDLDNDALPDLLALSGSNSFNWWIKNNGNGDFSTPQTLDPSASWLHWSQGWQTIAGDLDNDGDADVAARGPDTLVWFENGGNSLFSAHLLLTGQVVSGLNLRFVHDIDEDGNSDINFTRSYGIAYIPGLGGGQFGFLKYNAPEVYDIGRLETADVDGDGLTDIWINAGPDYRVGWYPNLGDNQWGERQIIDQEEYYLLFMTSVDFDQNGASDLLVSKQDIYGGNNAMHELAWYKNLGGGQFGPPETITHNIGVYAFTADADGDGDEDIFAPFKNDTLPAVAWLPNNGSGQFGLPVFVDPGSDSSYLIQAKDLDNDLDPDLLVRIKNDLVWYINDGAGTFAGPYLLFGNLYPNSQVTAFDVDGDGIADPVIFPRWWKNPGDGSPAAAPQMFDPALNFALYYTQFADLNGDGRTDILGTFDDYAFGWLPNLGNGNFGARRVLGLNQQGGFPTLPRVADLDNDGDLEYIYTKTSELAYYPDFIGLPAVSGYCFLDYNENGTQENDEPVLPGITLTLDPAALLSYTDDAGRFQFYVQPGLFQLGYVADSCWVLTTDSAALQLDLSVPLDAPLALGFRPNSNYARVGSFVTSQAPICGSTVQFWLTMRNDGCQPASVRYRFSAGSQLTWYGSIPSPNTAAGDTMIWTQFPPLQPGETRSFLAYIGVTPAVAGDVPVVAGIAEALGPDGQTVLHADTFLYPVEVLCSYDPNDKIVNVSELPPDYAADSSELTYTIRFQNTGNYQAINIRVRDTLDAALDWNTFRPLAASHPYTATLDAEKGIAQFDFLDIRLPDSLSNEAKSHGFVAFTIRLKPGLSPGQSTYNRAGIFFDVNPPVLTNWAETKVVEGVSTQPAPPHGEQFLVSPNPVTEMLTVRFPRSTARDSELQVFDLQGRLLMRRALQEGIETDIIDVSALPASACLLKYQGGDGRVACTLFIKI